MTKITEEMIATAYEIFLTDKKDISPLLDLKMNKSSANMTILWFNNLFKGQPFTPSVSAMQVEWILNKLYETNDFHNLKLALKSLSAYCVHNKDKPMDKVRKLVDEFDRKMATL